MRNYESRIGRPRFPALWEFSCFYSKFSLAFQIDCCFFNFWFYDNQSKSVLQWTLNYNRQVHRLKSFYNLPLRKPFFFSNGTSAVYPTPSQKLVFQKKETTQNVLTFDVYMYFEHLRLRWFHILFCPNIYNCSYFWSWKIDYTNSLISSITDSFTFFIHLCSHLFIHSS